MSLRKCSQSLWIVGAFSLLFAAVLQAQPMPVDRAADREASQIQIKMTVREVDHVKLKALTKSELGVREFLKASGLISTPDPISAAIGDAVGELLSAVSDKAVVPKPVPLRATAVRREPLPMTLLGHDIRSACKTLAEPELVVTSGREATMLSGGEVPVFVPRAGDPEVTHFLEFGLKLKVLARLLDHDQVSLVLDFTHGELDHNSVPGEPSGQFIDQRGFQLSSKMKLGEYLLVARQSGPETTRLIEVQPSLFANPDVAKSADDKSKALLQSLRNPAPQPKQSATKLSAEGNQVVIDNGDSQHRAKSVSIAQPALQQIQIEAVIYEVDPAKLVKLAEKSKSPVAELLKANGFKLTESHAVRDEPLSLDLENSQIGLAFKRVASPTIVTLENQQATFHSGGEFPIPTPKGQGEVGTNVVFREFGTKLTARPRIEADGQIALGVQVEVSTLNREHSVVVSGIEVPGLNVRRMNVAMKLKSGQYLLLANGTTETDLTQFVQLKVEVKPADDGKQHPTPVAAEAVSRATKANARGRVYDPGLPAAEETAKQRQTESPSSRVQAAESNSQPRVNQKSMPNVAPTFHDDGTLTVDDRWPVADIHVGQRVMIAPVTVTRSSLSARVELLWALAAEKAEGDESGTAPLEVIRIEHASPDSLARRVTMAVHSKNESGEDVVETKFDKEFANLFPTATTYCVIPGEDIEMLDFRWFDELYKALPSPLRPRPIEMLVGESFFVNQVMDPTVKSSAGHSESAPLLVTLDSEDAGRLLCRVTAQRPGMARLIHSDLSKANSTAILRRSDYLVKADTRELEHHIREQFPTAQVTITSVGTNSLLLRGTVGSDEESRGIAELAEQFAPKVLNRLKVGAVGEATSENSIRTTRLANGIEVTEVLPAGEGYVPMKPLTPDEPRRMGTLARPLELTKIDGTGRSAHPTRVKPASANTSKKNDQLRKLLDEIRELRQDVRRLNERLDREQTARPEKPEPPKASSPLGQERSEDDAAEFDKLVAQFNELIGQRRFAEAEAIAKQAKELEPNSSLAESMRWKAIFARRMADEEKRRASYNLPIHNPDWTRASLASQDSLPVGVNESEREAAAKLDAVVELEATDLPLRKVIQQLAASADVNIVLDKQGLEAAGVTPDTRVSATLKGFKLRSALQIVLEPLKLGHLFDGEVLKITSRERAAGPPIVVAYPVADLMEAGNVYDALSGLRNLIMVTVRGEKTWIDPNAFAPKIHCDGATKSLIVRHTADVHDELTAFLNLLRKTKQIGKSAKEAAAMSHLSQEEQRITERLQTKVTLHFENAPLKQTITHIAKLADFNIVLDESGLSEVGATLMTPVSVDVAQVRISTALRLLLEPLQLNYVVKNEVLRITSQQRAEGELVVLTYPVPDLIWQDNDPSGDLSNLCDMLMSMVDPNSWEVKGAPGTVRGNLPTRSLVVRQTRTNHTRIRDLLATVRNTKGDRP